MKDMFNEMVAGHKEGPVTLRHPVIENAEEFIEKSRRSEKFHKGLVSPPVDLSAYTDYMSNSASPTDRRLLIFEELSGELAGAINISQIFLKGFCSAYLGYYLFEGFTGRGIMSSALQGTVGYAFEAVGLHRLEANIQPWNSRSIALVRRCGFTREGFSRKYLKIDGEWRDHERWAIIKEDWLLPERDVR